MDARRISRQDLAALVTDLVAGGIEVVAPVRTRTGCDYAPIRRLEDATLDGGLPAGSLKRYVLPPTEPLFAWRQHRGDVEIDETPSPDGRRVVIGARPCDAAALEIVDRVMGWDTRDEPYFARRDALTVVALACPGADASCFCDAVGLAPDSHRGADLLLRPDGDGFLVEEVSAKGASLVSAHPGRFAGARVPEPLVPPPRDVGIDPVAVRTWLEGHFEDPLWQELALRCHGCGACAAVCPTCHCFDIVDEPDGVGHGTRRRNWDTCQAGRFTVHASGHNPRPDQAARFRQRVMHKLAVYPRRFGEVLCTGCGRCARSCPAGQDLPEILRRITRKAAEAAV